MYQDINMVRSVHDMEIRKVYILITIVITLCLLTNCSAPAESEPTAPAGDAQAFNQTKLEAGKLFTQRDDLSKLREAIALLAKLRNPDNRDYEVEWAFAKYNYFLGKYTSDEEEAESVFVKGKDAAKIASRMEPEKPDGHFWYGANLGELARKSPITVGLGSIGEIREAMNKVIELQPDYQGASAYDALAQLELATRIRGGSAEKAVEYLEKAIMVEKENTNVRLHLAEAYLAVNKDAEAKKQIDYLLQMKPNPEYMPEYNDAVEKAKRMLATRF